MKTFADVKRRFGPGVILICVENTYRPEVNGTRRRIEKVQTNAIACSLPDKIPASTDLFWTEFPPARTVKILDDNTFLLPFARGAVDHHVTLRFCADQ